MMKTMVNRLSVIGFSFLIAGLIFLDSCKQKRIERIDEFPGKLLESNSEFVMAATSGTIGSGSQIIVQLRFPPTKLKEKSGKIDSKIFKFSPRISGSAYLKDETTLIFEPEEMLPNGQVYSASLILSDLFNTEVEKAPTFDFSFNVVELLLKVETESITAYDFEKPENNFLNGVLFSTDQLNSKHLPGIVEATQNGDDLSVTWLDASVQGQYPFRIENIKRENSEGKLELSWDGSSIGSESEGTTEMLIPPLGQFSVLNVSVHDLPNQFIEIVFSDLPDNNQNPEGLIYFSDGSPISLSVEQNKVIVYPQSAVKGNVNLIIKKEFRSKWNTVLGEDISSLFYFEMMKPAVRFVDGGNIMPGKDSWILPFEAINLTAVDITVSKIFASNVKQFLQVNELWEGGYDLYRVGEKIYQDKMELNLLDKKPQSDYQAFAIDLSKLIKTEQGAIYRINLTFKKDYIIYDCPEGYSQSDDYWSNMENPCHEAYYGFSEKHFAEKNVIASNIGIMAKNSGSDMLIYTNNLLDTRAMENVNLHFYTFQQQLIQSSLTNEKGEVKVALKKEPFLVVAEKNGEFAYLKLDDGNSLSYSKFDTDGSNSSNGLKGFIYGDRGVWRPGDTLFISVIVRNSSGEFSNFHPATIELTNPLGKLAYQSTSAENVNGFYLFKIPTDSDAITGNYAAEIKVGGSSFYKNFKIENIKPNRLKINLTFNENILTQESKTAKLSANWLHGGFAPDLKADIRATFRSTKTSFEKYNNFNFDDPAKYFYPDEFTIFEGKTDKMGEAIVDLRLPYAKYAPGMLKAVFVTKVYEKGGDFSTDQVEKNYSPFSSYVGIKSPGPEKENGFLEVDKPLNFEIVTVNTAGMPVSVNNLLVNVYKLDWSWWYSGNESGLSSYISSHYDEQIIKSSVNTVNGKGNFSFTINYPDWGWYYVQVSDTASGHSTGTKIYLDWPSWYNRDQRNAPADANLLSLATDRPKYSIGDEITLSVPTPPNSRILVSIEKENRQLKSWWVLSDKEETAIKFEVSEEMCPNVYVFVSVIQPYSQTINDLPIRMYGVVPVIVENPQSLLEPVVDLPEAVRPNELYSVKIHEKNKKKMTYTLAIVDEGLLDLTRFKTPDPYAYFYAKEALAVKTWDLYDLVMGVFSGRIEQVFSIGGDDEALTNESKKKAVRFKPVVTFLGPFVLEEGKTASHQIKMPNYIGAVRCMVVAGQGNAFGKADKTMKVTQPLMVLGTLPRTLVPGEKLQLPVSVFVMDEKLKEATIKISSNDLFSVSETTKHLTVSQIGEQTIYFEMNTNQKQGIGKINIEAVSGNEKATYALEIDIRNPNPTVYNVSYHLINKGESLKFSPQFLGINGTNELGFSVSASPSLNLEKRLSYLVSYPYGCSEQVISSAYPQLYLDNLLDLNKDQKARIENNIKLAINKLSKRQLASGGFAIWEGQNSASDWVTSYAGNFLLLAKEKGYVVSSKMINSWINYQASEANKWNSNKSGYSSEFEQAYRLYTLALAGKASVGAMNRLAEKTDLNADAGFRLAAAYALIGQKAKALDILKGVKYNPETASQSWNDTYGSELRDNAMILETYLLLNENEKAIQLLTQITEALRSDEWMSTQTTAFCLSAVSQMIGDASRNAALQFSYSWNDINSGDITSNAAIYETKLEPGNGKNLVITNKSGQNLYATITTSGIPAPGNTVNESNNLELNVLYKNMNNEILNYKNIKQGTDFYAEITVKNTWPPGEVSNLVLSQIFPSGWEIINTRMLDLGAEFRSSSADYVDFRDDRVNMFFNLNRGEEKRFFVLLNAAYAGEFFYPATQCQAMYHSGISAAKGGGWVSVSK